MLREAVAALALVGALAPRAHAGDGNGGGDDVQQAHDRFDRGLALFDRGEFAGALAEFEASYALSHRWELLFNIAVTQKRLYRYDASVQTFAHYLKDGGDQVPAERRAQVETEQAETVKLTGQVRVTVDGADGPADVEIDGYAGWQTPIDHAVLVRGGTHEIVARRAGYVPATKKFELVSGDAIDVHLALAKAATGPAPGYLRVRSDPDGADLRDGDAVLGHAPWGGPLARGTHVLTAERTGYRPATQTIHLDPDEHRDLAFVLEPIPTPVYRRWYVLTGAGAVIAGAIVAGYLLTRSTPDVVIKYPSP